MIKASVNRVIFLSVSNAFPENCCVAVIPVWQTAGEILGFRHVTIQVLPSSLGEILVTVFIKLSFLCGESVADKPATGLGLMPVRMGVVLVATNLHLSHVSLFHSQWKKIRGGQGEGVV